jgi:hypothetical protein
MPNLELLVKLNRQVITNKKYRSKYLVHVEAVPLNKIDVIF